MDPVEDLYAPARAWRTLGMALDMLLLSAGAIVVVASVLPDAAFSTIDRGAALGLGVVLLAVGVLTLRMLVLQGRKVGAVYGIKAARRAGLVPEEPPKMRWVRVREPAGERTESSSQEGA